MVIEDLVFSFQLTPLKVASELKGKNKIVKKGKWRNQHASSWIMDFGIEAQIG